METDNTEHERTSAPAEETSDAVPTKKKRSRLKRFLIALGILIAGVVFIIFFCLGPIVKFTVNTFGASILGVDKCSIESAKIYPISGHVRFEKIFIGKPVVEGEKFSKNLFSVDLVDVDVDMLSLFTQKKILDRFEILNPTATYERLISGETNINAVLKNVLGESVQDDTVDTGTQVSQKEPTQATDDPSEEIFIGARYFVIENVRVSAYVRGMPIVFPPMSADFRRGLGIDDDLSPLAFGAKVAGNFMSIIDFFRKSILGDMAGTAIGMVSDAAVLTGDLAKATAGTAVTVVSDAATLTGDAAKVTADAALGAVSDAAELTGDAAKATVDAVSHTADSILNIFKSKQKEEK